MLAVSKSPIPQTFSTGDKDDGPASYKPAPSLEAFNKLLGPPVEFIQGSSTGSIAIPEGRYQPINDGSAVEAEELTTTAVKAETPAPLPSSPSPKERSSRPAHFYNEVDVRWPAKDFSVASGLLNTGNSCFLNSTLQILMHTPPLLHFLQTHHPPRCPLHQKFCMACCLREVTFRAHTQNAAFIPSAVSNKLQVIAKHMRRGRQEDSHEFLRYAIDSLQRSCLGGRMKVEQKEAESTVIHKIFGGKLRSRVTCKGCGHNSDTFDSILDLSLDIHKAELLKDAFKKFVASDFLQGADKYKCEKCNKHVNAEKRFSIHEAPTVLTIHLKRFSPLGRKIGHFVGYDDHINLQPYMSEGAYGPTYSLYGIICHLGSGPNSGHYYAFAKSRSGQWHEMNDDLVSPVGNTPKRKSAYILFYIRNKGQKLDSALVPPKTPDRPPIQNGLVAGMKKRKSPDEDGDGEDIGETIQKPFIGPILPPHLQKDGPSPLKRQATSSATNEPVTDPQAERIKQKIAQAEQASTSLVEGYSSDAEDEADTNEAEKHTPLPSTSPPRSSSPGLPSQPTLPSSPSSRPPPLSPVYANSSPLTSIPPVSAASFYSTSGVEAARKRKKSNEFGSSSSRPNSQNGFNPYTRLGGSRISKTYAKKKARGF